MVPKRHLRIIRHLLLLLVVGRNLVVYVLYLLLDVTHSVLEALYALSESARKLRNLLTTEKKQNDKCDYKNLPCSQISNQKQIVHIFTNLI